MSIMEINGNPEEIRKFVQKRIEADMRLFENLRNSAKEILEMPCLGCQLLSVFAQQHAIEMLKRGLEEGMAIGTVIAPMVHGIVKKAEDYIEIDQLEKLFKMKGGGDKGEMGIDDERIVNCEHKSGGACGMQMECENCPVMKKGKK